MNNEEKLKNQIKFLQKILRQKNELISNSYKKFGRTIEVYAPFTKKFPTQDLSKFVFLGKPIDGIIFEHDRIIIVEIKLGQKTPLTKNQERIKKLVEEGKVEFQEVRYD